MAKKNESKIVSVFKIIFEGLCLYFKNIDKFMKYMTFPILGQVLGLILIFSTQYLFATNLEKIVVLSPIFDNVSVVFTTLLIITIPAFIIFLAAFWKYLVAMGSLNSMANNLICSAKLDDLSIHNDTVNRRLGTYVSLLLILSLISFLGVIPLFWIPLLVVMIFLCLVFQVFALEENLNAIEICKKSAKMIKGNFLKASLLLFLLYVISYIMIPELINYAFTKLSIYEVVNKPLETYLATLPLMEVQSMIQMFVPDFSLDFSAIPKTIASIVVSTVVICYTLPLRSICCTMLYKDLELKKLKEKKIKEL